MLILTGNNAVNLGQVFYFSVEVPIKQLLSVKGAKAYVLTAHHGNREGDPDSVVMKKYHTEQEAFADLSKIMAAYKVGMAVVDLEKD